MSFLEESWEEREEVVYKELFGDTGAGIYPLSNTTFETLNAKEIDPRWLTHGVFKCPPNDKRKTWIYITSGMSNPWETEEPEEYSGLGVEFLLETADEENWAVQVLQSLMAYNLLLAAGQMGNYPLLDYGHRIPLAISDKIKTMMLTQPHAYPQSVSIKSGCVDLLQVVGITQAELDFAKENSSNELTDKFIAETGGLITAKDRDSIV